MKKLKKLLLPATIAILASSAAYAGKSCHTATECADGKCETIKVCIKIPEPDFDF